MMIHHPKLCNTAHAQSLSVFIAFKGAYFYILFAITAAGVAAFQCLPYIIHSADYILHLVL